MTISFYSIMLRTESGFSTGGGGFTGGGNVTAAHGFGRGMDG